MEIAGVGHLDTWKILEEMITDFREKGRAVPAKIMDDLKSARTMIRILKADASCRETAQKIDEYLGSVESYLVSEGEKMFGATYADERLKRLEKASREAREEEHDETRFVSGLPREKKWIRVKPSSELPVEKLKALAEGSKLSHKTQNDGSFLVYGEEERVRDFVKKMTTKYGVKAEK
jgi:hypothetical protein